jgi:tetratricopeptide (TPR) repeat protein
MNRSIGRVLVVLTMALGYAASPTWARAQDSGTPEHTDQAARLLFQSGVEAYQNGEYDTALQRFRQAYELSQRPALLYNIGTTLDRLRRDDETIQTFEAYLAADPDTSKRAEVEARLRLLHEQADARHAQDEARAAELEQERQAREAAEHEVATADWDTADAEPKKPIPLAVFIATGAAAVALGAVGIGFGVRTSSLNDLYEGTTDPVLAARRYNDAAQSQNITNGMLFSAGGLAIATVVFVFFTDFGGGSSEDAAPVEGDDGEGGEEAAPPATVRSRTTPSFAAGPGGFTFDLVHRF